MPSNFQKAVIASTEPGAIEYIQSSLIEARIQFTKAQENLNSAEQIVATDLSGAFTLAYESGRKSIGSVLTANGMRLKQIEKAHKIFVAISRISSFDQRAWAKFDWMRVRRHDTQYANPEKPDVTLEDCEVAITAAKLMLSDVKKILESLG